MRKITLQNSLRKAAASAMLLCCLTTGVAGYACAAEMPEPPEDNGPVAHVEQTQWHYRRYEGRCQKRLWSITRGIWLTDWEDC